MIAFSARTMRPQAAADALARPHSLRSPSRFSSPSLTTERGTGIYATHLSTAAMRYIRIRVWVQVVVVVAGKNKGMLKRRADAFALGLPWELGSAHHLIRISSITFYHEPRLGIVKGGLRKMRPSNKVHESSVYYLLIVPSFSMVQQNSSETAPSA